MTDEASYDVHNDTTAYNNSGTSACSPIPLPPLLAIFLHSLSCVLQFKVWSRVVSFGFGNHSKSEIIASLCIYSLMLILANFIIPSYFTFAIWSKTFYFTSRHLGPRRIGYTLLVLVCASVESALMTAYSTDATFTAIGKRRSPTDSNRASGGSKALFVRSLLEECDSERKTSGSEAAAPKQRL